MMTDPVADMLTRIRNANLEGHPETTMPTSKLKEKIAQLLVDEGYLESYAIEGEAPSRQLKVTLRYGEQRARVIKGLQRVSTPGRRIYRGTAELPRVQGGLGVAIVSTSQGLLPDREARKRRLGGEILCEVW